MVVHAFSSTVRKVIGSPLLTLALTCAFLFSIGQSKGNDGRSIVEEWKGAYMRGLNSGMMKRHLKLRRASTTEGSTLLAFKPTRSKLSWALQLFASVWWNGSYSWFGARSRIRKIHPFSPLEIWDSWTANSNDLGRIDQDWLSLVRTRWKQPKAKWGRSFKLSRATGLLWVTIEDVVKYAEDEWLEIILQGNLGEIKWAATVDASCLVYYSTGTIAREQVYLPKWLEVEVWVEVLFDTKS